MPDLKKRRSWTFNKHVLKAIKREAKLRRGDLAFGLSDFIDLDCVASALDNLTFDDILRGCINESDLMEIVGCLDVIAREQGVELIAYDKDGKRWYPVR